MKKEKVTIYKLKNGENLSTASTAFNKNPTELLLDNNFSPKDFFEGNIIFIRKN